MPNVRIIVKTKDDKEPALPSDKSIEVDLESFIIREAGMQFGKSSVALHFKLPDGTDAIAQTSADIFRGMARSLKGAEERFAELRSTNPNQVTIHDTIRDADSGHV